MGQFLFVTGEQIRAGRALARIEQSELARLCNVSLETIKRLERIRGAVAANVRTLEAILQAFDGLGIQFDSCEDGGVGVRMPPTDAAQKRSRRPGQARGGAERAQPMHRLIYCSTAATAAADATRALLDDVLGTAAPRNDTNDVTGVLVAYDGRFLQVLEGPKVAVQQTYGAISTDPAHRNLQVIESRATTAARQFPDWSLCYAAFPADCQVLARQGVSSGGFRPETYSTASALDVLSTARDLQRANPQSQRAGIVNCPLVSECENRSCSFVAVPKSAPLDAASLRG